MANTPNETLLQVDPVDIAPGERRTVVKPLDGEAIARAITNLKGKIDLANHNDVDAAMNQAMARFIDRRYSQEFASTIQPLNDALVKASKGETARLASLLGLSNITREGSGALAQNIGQVGAVRVAQAQDAQTAEVLAREAQARQARETAERARLDQAQQEAQIRGAGRLAGLRDFLGGKPADRRPPTDVASK